MLKSIIDILFPNYCLICSRLGYYICPYCKRKLIPSIPECYKCRRLSAQYKTHTKCLDLYSLDSAFYGWQYNKDSSSLIKTFKYKGAYSIGEYLSSILAERILATSFLKQFSNPLFIPIPMHPKKRKLRGFNQTEILAENLSVLLSVPVNKDILKREVYLKAQAEKNKEEREIIEEDIFSFKNIPLKFKEIILIDDVITTGTTLERAAKAIRETNKNVSINAIALLRGKPNYSPDEPDKESISSTTL